MNLLPDFCFEGLVFSMQEPYTMDGDIIIKATETIRVNGANMIFFDTEDPVSILHQRKTVDMHRFLDALQMFIDSNNNFRDTVYVNEYGQFIDDVPVSEEDWFRRVKKQCARIQNSYNRNWTIDELCSSLRAQGRISDNYASVLTSSIDPYVEIFDRYSYNSFGEPITNVTHTISTPDQISGQTLTADTTINFSINGDAIDARTYNVLWGIDSSIAPLEENDDYIHGWNYKPTFIYHKLEEEHSPLLLGAEIEVGGNSNTSIDKNLVVKKCIQIINGSDSTEENLIYSTSDSTVQIELDTMPCSLEYHKTMNYREMFEYLDQEGYKGHDCSTAGLHIHADRKYLGDTKLKQQLVISKILYVLEKFNEQICTIARRNNSYSKFVGDGKNESSVVELYEKYRSQGKHVALNLSHKDTIEFRCFKSTLKYETFILTLEFVQNIINFCKKINIEEIELVTWDDLMETFSDDLQEYYYFRLSKQEIKKSQKPVILPASNSINTECCCNILNDNITITNNNITINTLSSFIE